MDFKISEAELRLVAGNADEVTDVEVGAAFALAEMVDDVKSLQPEEGGTADVMGLQALDGRELSSGGSCSDGEESAGIVGRFVTVFVRDARDFSISEAGVDGSGPEFVDVWQFSLGDTESASDISRFGGDSIFSFDSTRVPFSAS